MVHFNASRHHRSWLRLTKRKAAIPLTLRGAKVAEKLHEEHAEREPDAVRDHVDNEGGGHHHPAESQQT